MASAGQIAEAQDAAFDSGSGDVIGELIKKGFVDYEDMLSMLAQQYGMEMMYLDDYDIPFEVIDSLKSDYARYYQVVPVYKEDSMLTVAMADPTDVEKLDTLRYLLGGNVDAVIAPEKQIQEALDRYYPENEEDTGSVTKDVNMDAADMAIESADAEVGGMEEDDEAPIIRLVSKLIVDAYKMRASDIHFEPMEKRYRVRYRVDGALREVDGPPKYLQANFTSRVKIMAHLDITEKRIPQDGRIQISVGDKELDLRERKNYDNIRSNPKFVRI